MPTNASTPFLGGNPLVFTSGWVNPPNAMIKGMWKIQRIYWERPDIANTSSLLINKRTASGMIYAKMDAETSNVSQVLNLGDIWWQDPYVACVPTGTLFIYLDN